MRARVEYSGLRDLQGRFQRVAAEDREEISSSVREATELVYNQARDNIAAMFRTSGRMQNALQMMFSNVGGIASGSVSIEGIGYATQEFGGRGPFVIPSSPLPPGRALHFIAEDGQNIFTRQVIHGPLPERSYLRLALEQKRAEIEELFAGRVQTRFVR